MSTLSVESTSLLFLLLPSCFASIFLLFRIIFAFLEQRELRSHAASLFAYLLFVLPRIPKEQQTAFLLLRHTFYQALMKDKKMYSADIEQISSYLDLHDRDRAIKDAIHFLKSRCIYVGK